MKQFKKASELKINDEIKADGRVLTISALEIIKDRIRIHFNDGGSLLYRQMKEIQINK